MWWWCNQGRSNGSSCSETLKSRVPWWIRVEARWLHLVGRVQFDDCIFTMTRVQLFLPDPLGRCMGRRWKAGRRWPTCVYCILYGELLSRMDACIQHSNIRWWIVEPRKLRGNGENSLLPVQGGMMNIHQIQGKIQVLTWTWSFSFPCVQVEVLDIGFLAWSVPHVTANTLQSSPFYDRKFRLPVLLTKFPLAVSAAFDSRLRTKSFPLLWYQKDSRHVKRRFVLEEFT